MNWVQTVPFVCFVCCESWKMQLPFYWQECPDLLLRRDLRPIFQQFKCQHCGGSLSFLGRYFKTPRKNDLKQWRKVRMLYEAGWSADGYSVGPRTLRDAREYLRFLPDEIVKEQNRLEAEKLYNRHRKERISRSRRKRLIQR